MERPTHFLLDNDGVMRRENLQLPGVPEFYAALTRLGIRHVLLSNNSRVTSEGLVDQMRAFGVSDFSREQAMTSAEGTAAFLREHPSENMGVFLVGEEGLHSAVRAEGISVVNDHWDAQRLDWQAEPPTDVAVGFHTSVDWRKELAPAYNAIAEQRARFIGTNPDKTYRHSSGLRLPANGSTLDFFQSTGKEPIIVSKPEIGMAEAALHRMGACKEHAAVAVVGDTIDQDMWLAENLRRAGWRAEGWLVLSGDVRREEVSPATPVGRVFEDIRAITRKLLSR